MERQAEALAAQERELAQREASLHNEQDQLRQQRALLDQASSAIDKERAEARDMLKVAMLYGSLPSASGTTCQLVPCQSILSQDTCNLSLVDMNAVSA